MLLRTIILLVHFASFYDFSIRIWKCCKSVLYFVFHFITIIFVYMYYRFNNIDIIKYIQFHFGDQKVFQLCRPNALIWRQSVYFKNTIYISILTEKYFKKRYLKGYAIARNTYRRVTSLNSFWIAFYDNSKIGEIIRWFYHKTFFYKIHKIKSYMLSYSST